MRQLLNHWHRQRVPAWQVQLERCVRTFAVRNRPLTLILASSLRRRPLEPGLPALAARLLDHSRLRGRQPERLPCRCDPCRLSSVSFAHLCCLLDDPGTWGGGGSSNTQCSGSWYVQPTNSRHAVLNADIHHRACALLLQQCWVLWQLAGQHQLVVRRQVRQGLLVQRGIRTHSSDNSLLVSSPGCHLMLTNDQYYCVRVQGSTNIKQFPCQQGYFGNLVRGRL